jgi:hypothetical protein
MSTNIQKSFFEFIAAADSEKVHSRTIAWIFSEYCQAFNRQEKYAILNKLIKTRNSNYSLDNNEQIESAAEYNGIDILLSGSNWMIVIENKIKSSEHGNQLLKYEFIATQEDKEADKIKGIFETNGKELDDNKRLKNGKTPYYIYLSLIEEKPGGTPNKWIPVTYSNFQKILSDHFKQNTKSADHYIVECYLKTLNNLSLVVDSFIGNVKDYSFIFEEGKQLKANLSNEVKGATNSAYIKTLQLETLLQKLFYRNLLKEINLPESVEKTVVGESRGTALLDFFFKNIKMGEQEYYAILQFQGNAVKLALAVSRPRKNAIITAESKKIIDQRKVEFEKKLRDIIISNKDKKLVKDMAKLINDGAPINLSTPKSAEGFISFRLNTKEDGFWQLSDLPRDYVEEKLQLALHIFKQMDESN